MSCNSWMGCTITVLDSEYNDAAMEWVEAACTYKENGKLNIELQWNDAGWFDRAASDLKEELSGLPIPLDAWEAYVRYEYYDEPSADGSFVEFTIENGKMVNFKESRIEMVEVEPWFKFDMEEE